MTTVFDVASEFVERSDNEMETLKLQKLCFYAFGWYAHLTAEPLFGEAFYAMEKGPVVGELLSAHSRRKTISLDLLDEQRDIREDSHDDLSDYQRAVVDAVWSAYGDKDSWELIDLTHAEGVWQDAWESRRQGSRRGDLPHEVIIDYFLSRAPKDDEELTQLPPAMVSVVLSEQLATIDSTPQVHTPFIQAMRELRHES